MALLRKLFFRKPPDGLLEICERVYVFDCCFTTDAWKEEDYKVYIDGIMSHFREHLPDASILVFNFGEDDRKSVMANILSKYDLTIMDYPKHYEGCPLLKMEVIHHFLRSSESWLSLGQNNVLLMHCVQGGWPVLSFMLAALLIYHKQYSGEQRTLDMVYKQAPRELLHLLSPLNPIPSQLRYLQYISRRNVAVDWPPTDRALTLDCVILRSIPNFDGEGGCRPIFRIYGQDPCQGTDQRAKVLYSTPRRSKTVRPYKQAECELIKIDISCHIRGDVVVECISLSDDLESEMMMFRVMFNTAFIRSNILIVNRDEVDMLWDAKDHFPKDFRAEILLSEMDAAACIIAARRSCFEEKEGLPIEAFAKVQEIFSNVDWLDNRTDMALTVLQQINASNVVHEKLDTCSPHFSEASSVVQEASANTLQGTRRLTVSDDEGNNSLSVTLEIHAVTTPKESPSSSPVEKERQSSGVSATLEAPNTSEITFHKRPEASQRILESSSSSKDSQNDTTKHQPPYVSTPKNEVNHPINASPAISSSTMLISDATKTMDNCISLSPRTPPRPPHPRPLPISGTTKAHYHPASMPGQTSVTNEDRVIQDSCPSTLSSSTRNPPSSIARNQLPPSLPLHKPSPPSSQPPSTPPRKDNIPIRTEPPALAPLSSSPPPPMKEELAIKTKPPPPPPPFSIGETFVGVGHAPPHPPPPPPSAPKGETSFGVGHSPPSPPSKGKISIVDGHPPTTSPSGEEISVRVGPPPPPPPPLKREPYAGAAPPPTPPPPPKGETSVGGGPPPAPPQLPKGETSRGVGPSPPPPPPQLPGTSSVGVGPPPPPPPPHLPGTSSVGIGPPPAPPAPPHPQGQTTGAKPSTASPAPPPPPGPLGKGLKIGNSAGPRSGSLGGKGILSKTIASNKNQKKLKPLYWLKLSRAVQGSLWEETQKSDDPSTAPEIDMSELESLFGAAVPNDAKKSNARRPVGPKSEKVQLIEHRRAYNCEIMLSKVKIPLPDLMSYVLALDDEAIDDDQVENIIKFCPTKEEMELLKGYTGDKEKLGKCEQFFLELMKVPRVELKLRVFLFKKQFIYQVSDLRKSLNMVSSAADEIRDSVKLKRIMQTILSLGNALNQGTARGSAIGFRLDSLLKLTETRARNNKMTLMHYLCKVLVDKLPEVLDFSQDLEHLEPAAKVQLKFLAEEMQAISKGLEKVVQELSTSENDGPISDNFRKTLKEFLCFAEGEVRTLASLYSAVGRNVDNLILYFGEDPARCPFEQVASTLLNFTRMFNKAQDENSKQLEQEIKKAAGGEKPKVGTAPNESEQVLHAALQSSDDK